MIELKRRVTVEHETPSDVNPVGIIGVKNEWLYDGHPIIISIGGSRHFIRAKDVEIEHIIEEPESPEKDRSVYLFRSRNGHDIDSITLFQSWIQLQSVGRRYHSQSFPMEDVVQIPEGSSILDCLYIKIPEPKNIKGTYSLPINEYLERKNEATALSN